MAYMIGVSYIIGAYIIWCTYDMYILWCISYGLYLMVYIIWSVSVFWA